MATIQGRECEVIGWADTGLYCITSKHGGRLAERLEWNHDVMSNFCLSFPTEAAAQAFIEQHCDKPATPAAEVTELPPAIIQRLEKFARTKELSTFTDLEVSDLLVAYSKLRTELAAARAEAERSKEFTHAWYACRLRWLEDFFRGDGKDLPIADKFWGIIANGTPDIHTPPTYQQMLNVAKWRAEKAEAERVWRDIETAPKDGTRVLLGFESQSYEFTASSGYWTDHNGGGWVRNFPWQPTLWMPLPEPPTAKGAGRE